MVRASDQSAEEVPLFGQGPVLPIKVTMALAEARVLSTLDRLKCEMITLKALAARETHGQLSQQYAAQLQQLASLHHQRKQQRDRQRFGYTQPPDQPLEGEALSTALSALNQESQQDSTERRRLKQRRNQALQPFIQAIAQADRQVQALKLEYQTLSKAWQAQLQTAYFAEYAGASVPPLSVVYQDDHLIVVNKPAGLLSVPGRRYHLQDSAVNRLRCQLPESPFLQAVHRLDRDTSGLLAIASSASAHRQLSQQFAQRQVHKTYEAILSQRVSEASGTIELPLSAQAQNPPKQRVDFQQGKPSKTDFKVLRWGHYPKVEFVPYTGRTHQLRVHAAHREGLNASILGDTLYSEDKIKERLHLHATALRLVHPMTKEVVYFNSPSSF